MPAVLVKQFLTFGMVGVAGFFVDAGSYYLAESYIENPYVCRLFSYFCAVTSTWLINRTVTFKKKYKEISAKGLLLEWMHFFVSQISGFFVNYSTFSLLIYFFGFFNDFPILAIAAGSLAGLTINFCAAKFFIYRA